MAKIIPSHWVHKPEIRKQLVVRLIHTSQLLEITGKRNKWLDAAIVHASMHMGNK